VLKSLWTDCISSVEVTVTAQSTNYFHIYLPSCNYSAVQCLMLLRTLELFLLNFLPIP